MSSYLEGIDISGLQLQNDWDTGISSISEVAISGNLIVFESDKNYRDLTLMGGDTWGYLKHSILTQIKSLASVKGATYTLVFEGDSYTVRFKTEEIPVIEAELIGNPTKITDDLFYNNITIKLMEV